MEFMTTLYNAGSERERKKLQRLFVWLLIAVWKPFTPAASHSSKTEQLKVENHLSPLVFPVFVSNYLRWGE